MPIKYFLPVPVFSAYIIEWQRENKLPGTISCHISEDKESIYLKAGISCKVDRISIKFGRNSHQIEGIFYLVDGIFLKFDRNFYQIEGIFYLVDGIFIKFDRNSYQIEGIFYLVDGIFLKFDRIFHQIEGIFYRVDGIFINVDGIFYPPVWSTYLWVGFSYTGQGFPISMQVKTGFF